MYYILGFQSLRRISASLRKLVNVSLMLRISIMSHNSTAQCDTCTLPSLAVLYSAFKEIASFNPTPSDLLCVRVKAEKVEKPGGQLSAAAQRELMERCEDQFAQLEQVQF